MSLESENMELHGRTQGSQFDPAAVEEGRVGPSSNPRSFESEQRQGDGFLRMVDIQSKDSTYRLVQDSAAAASAVSWSMERRTQESFSLLAQQYKERDERWMATLEEKVKPRVLEQYHFLQSRIAVESLEEPGKAAFERFTHLWPGLEVDGFVPVEASYRWRHLSKPSGHEDVAREILAASPPWMRKIFSSTKVDSEPGLESYDGTKITRWVAVISIIFIPLLTSVPVIMLAVDAVPSIGGRLALIVSSNALMTSLMVLSGVQPGIAIGLSMAYNAVMVNVDV